MTGYGSGGYTARYMDDTVATASPGRLLVMLYDRLLLDLDRATACVATGQSARTHLLHAQEILLELRASLDVNAWSGGAALANVYVYCLETLISANVSSDIAAVSVVRDLLEPLRDAWNEAVTVVATTGAQPVLATQTA